MNRSKIIEELIKILENEFGCVMEDICDKEILRMYDKEIVLSSMDYIKFVICVENLFEINWPDEWLILEKFTINEVTNLIKKEIKAVEENC